MLNLLFPRCCLQCGKEGSWACAACRSQVFFRGQVSVEHGLAPLISLFSFEPGLVRELLHNLKYNGIYEAAGTLGALVTEKTEGNWLQELLSPAVLVPVPLSSARRKNRGYNQTEKLALVFGSWLGIPVWTEALCRTNRKSQVGQGAVARQIQTATSFAWAGRAIPPEYADRPWMVVDDVCTTGSTLAACAAQLRPHSQFPIGGLVVARKE